MHQGLKYQGAREVLGLGLFALFSLLSLFRAGQTGFLFFWLLALKNALTAWYYWDRPRAEQRGTHLDFWIAAISAGMPFLYQLPQNAPPLAAFVSAALQISGLTLSTLATFELGKRFSVSPARRGNLCRTGPYAWLPHPIYTGYVIAESGFCFVEPKNIFLWLLSAFLYRYRTLREEAVLSLSPSRACLKNFKPGVNFTHEKTFPGDG